MSIQSETNRISGNINAAFALLKKRGSSVPTNATSDNLVAAIESEIVPVKNGGTEAKTAAQARINLGVDISEETINMFANAGYPIE